MKSPEKTLLIYSIAIHSLQLFDIYVQLIITSRPLALLLHLNQEKSTRLNLCQMFYLGTYRI